MKRDSDLGNIDPRVPVVLDQAGKDQQDFLQRQSDQWVINLSSSQAQAPNAQAYNNRGMPHKVSIKALKKLIEFGIDVPAQFYTGTALSSDMLDYYQQCNPEYVSLIADILGASDL